MVTILGVRKIFMSNKSIVVQLTDNTERSFDSLEAAKERVGSLLGDSDKLADLITTLALARYLQIDKDAKTPWIMEGKSFSITDEANTLITMI